MPRSNSAPNQQAEWFAAFSEPTRLGLIRALAAGEKTVTQLASEINTEIVNVSHHLKIMKDAELVTAVKDGRFMIYSLVGAAVVKGMLELSHNSGAKVTLPLE
ncbi:family transcriptional regulator : Regulatory protein ArsR OS=Planctomyces brasiliensis (strain ATCC 49424 / DSM 5305 / JCM 21570 / NBRC 103401 / IFAM 1448) GN=Plabr_1561 PE=4 SV=1: HTH_20 [Gemmata massiliana]|uniref:HTH arsR-type domain-containing protein n=1 Tax=Gemmata massiliana TaxID=1210884 RepID=A0A6P2DFS2_9BACT|nr:metalloregulator ArsR/SmtB family transcription factor [Gemmata massiliana]VTR98554.1 family transcriptional regulator : Regulatory protein ArsR OS=Planctomyces brasiliensis (strain ATCC 49424 / DSM 5305 / JCM 21570 / NBRC 103401 / IFAM 1448) GN=Plabr_1561 PE=4 SV=1: HTH_20 [Gemmata massiliana]